MSTNYTNDQYISISGFGDPNANGLYYYSYMSNDNPVYKKDENYKIFYSQTLMPYTNSPGYFLTKTTAINGAIPITKLSYLTRETNVAAIGASTVWISVLEQWSGEADTGASREGIDSSSSSVSSSSSSGSSLSSLSSLSSQSVSSSSYSSMSMSSDSSDSSDSSIEINSTSSNSSDSSPNI